ncbi:MAG: NBR1-Ig-like domain-containing protein [bacterium]|nr:NBR1-Ig-like domain-containing protein [bacterium]
MQIYLYKSSLLCYVSISIVPEEKPMSARVLVRMLVVLAILAAVAGCAKQSKKLPVSRAPDLNTIEVTTTPVDLSKKRLAPATDVGLRFVRDDGPVQDGVQLPPGQRFTKRWILENQNPVTVPAHAVRLSKETSFGPIVVPEAIWIKEVSPGQSVSITAEMSVKANAPDGVCHVQYGTNGVTGFTVGIFALIEVKKGAPPLPPDP